MKAINGSERAIQMIVNNVDGPLPPPEPPPGPVEVYSVAFEDGSPINYRNRRLEQESIEERSKLTAAMGEELREEYLELLDRSMRGSLDVNELQSGLDQLHTFVTKFLRRLCEERGSSATENKTLQRLLTEYVTNMSAAGAIETKMTERILRSSIANLEAFQTFCSEHSITYHNPILNSEESLLVTDNVMSAIRFIHASERKRPLSTLKAERTRTPR